MRVAALPRLGLEGRSSLPRASHQENPRDAFTPSRRPSSSERPQTGVAWWAAAPEIPAVAGRNGGILNQSRILKRDQHPGVRSASLQGSGHWPIPGAPNYRQAQGTTIHGLAQPTLRGLGNVLTALGAGSGGESGEVLWVNLREEPVLYIDGKPYCLRDRRFPFGNLTATGISGHSLEEIEENLRQEVLDEASQRGGRIVVHDETPAGRLMQRELELDPERLQTPRQAFENLRGEGYRVEYHRVPVSDEKSPEPQDFDELVRLVREHSAETPRIFNCQAGRGRTTTGMVIADLVDQARSGRLTPTWQALAIRPLLQEHLEEAAGGSLRGALLRHPSLQEVARSLSEDPASQNAADRAIDRFDHVQNLRRIVLGRPIDPGPYSSLQEATLARGRDFLERYFMLVRFAQYLTQQPGQGTVQPFTTWLAQQPGLYDSMEELKKAVDLWHSAFPAP